MYLYHPAGEYPLSRPPNYFAHRKNDDPKKGLLDLYGIPSIATPQQNIDIDMDALYQYNPSIFGLMNLEETSPQADMDQAALNDELSHMVSDIKEKQTQLQQKIYSDMTK